MLADKVSGHLVGLWLLVAEHLRLGTWDLVRGWTEQSGERIEPRLALQMIHEAALCARGIRNDRTLTNRGGFELVNGLPFVGGDGPIHRLLASRTIDDSQRLQVALGKLRRASGDFPGKRLIIDPHRVPSSSRRRMRQHCHRARSAAVKVAQTFWVVDADSCQPICFTTATSSRTVSQATPGLLQLASEILPPGAERPLVLADAEHGAGELIDDILQRRQFDILVPLANSKTLQKQLTQIPREAFTPRWAGYATLRRPYRLKRGTGAGVWQYVQRCGEREEEWSYKAYVCTLDRDEVEPLTVDFPQRWNIEEYFNAYQPMGWNRAGTMNLNVRYGQMTMALIANAILRQLRQRLGSPVAEWDAEHFAKDLLLALDGDVRVSHDTIIVTYYNAPNAALLQQHYEDLPTKLQAENVAPEIPWLYGFKLDFRFR